MQQMSLLLQLYFSDPESDMMLIDNDTMIQSVVEGKQAAVLYMAEKIPFALGTGKSELD